MTPYMDATLKEMIQTALDSFFLSLRGGSPELYSFLGIWTNLHGLIQMNEDKLQEETLVMAYNFSSVVNTVATSMIELQDESDRLCRETLTDISTILDQEMDNLSISTQPKRSSSAAIPPYVKASHEWLLSNLHNPYPSKEIRDKISFQTASSRKEVDDWFVDVRKRIGWNRLRLKHYSNKRSKIVDAATHFFKGTPQTLHGIDPTANSNSDFEAIAYCAKELYSDKPFKTPLEAKLDIAVGDLRSKAKVRARPEELPRQVAKSGTDIDLQHLHTYPSPEPSPERSPEPSTASPLPIPDATPTISRKRRNFDRDSPEIDIEDRRDKRSRLDSHQISCDLAVASLPSPAVSLSNIIRGSSATPSDQGLSEIDCVVLPTPPIPAAPSGKRKRRLSDAGHDGPAKRPHNALAVPRLQTVSDPLPLVNPISELYKTVFGQTIGDSIPDPVSVESLDHTPVEVDFYNYDSSPDIMQPILLADSSLGPCPEPPSPDKSQVTDPSLDFLFENYLTTPPQATDIPFFTHISSHDHSTFENMFPTQPPQEDILSDPYFQIPGLWDFQGNDDTFSNVVSSIGTLFSSDPVPPQIDSILNEKEAKRKQIEALRAQLQSLEAEP